MNIKAKDFLEVESRRDSVSPNYRALMLALFYLVNSEALLSPNQATALRATLNQATALRATLENVAENIRDLRTLGSISIATYINTCRG